MEGYFLMSQRQHPEMLARSGIPNSLFGIRHSLPLIS